MTRLADDQATPTPLPSRRLSRRLASRVQKGASPPGQDSSQIRPWLYLVAGLWFGLLAGLLETALQFGRSSFFDPSILGSLQMNRQAIWMITAANLLLIGPVGVGLFALSLVYRGRGLARLALPLLAALAVLTLLLCLRGLGLVSAILLAAGSGAALGRRVRLSGPRFQRVLLVGTPTLLLLFLGLFGVDRLTEWSRERTALAALPPATAKAPNFMLLVLDTVRADALSCMGYHRKTTPNLDALAARGVVFQQAFAPGAWTLPSHASLFTGRWPGELSARIDRPLDDTYPTIAEYLATQGYQTAGFVANTYFCNAWYGLGRGFLRYEDSAFSTRTVLASSGLGRRVARHLDSEPNERPFAHFPRKTGQTINGEFLAWLDARPTDRPFFTFLNYFDAHDPYLLLQEPKQPFGLRPTTEAERWIIRDWHLGDTTKRTERESQLARDCYDDCLAALDVQLGKLFHALEERGLDRNTWIIVTADHGEQFGDHGLWGHGSSLYRPVIHVPLLVIPPKDHSLATSPKSIRAPVSLRNVPATLAELAGAQAPAPFPGQSLAMCWESQCETAAYTDPVLAEIVTRPPDAPANWQKPMAVIDQGHCYLRQSDGREELYSLDNDPDQLQNLVAQPDKQALLEKLRAQLR